MINRSNKIRKRINGALFILICMSIPTGCIDRARVAACSVRDISASSWSTADTLTWQIADADSLARFDVAISVRHGYGYPYCNLALELTALSGDSLLRRDTIDFRLAQADGSWIGSGWGSMLEVTTSGESVQSPRSDTLTFLLRHIMNDRTISDINSVGLKATRR